ncbi:hypothetical protein B0T22DRAFT_136706 [Podospora appendiculata]|uniref:Uncharacterized protein n=1 Tax=Podospora appendiculata TaxID=314037 RepID=A0AAE0X8A9_9PEZI|nr:hypothetical protein B0T22DRAFT_136706 [Podospora appendiculata]
MLEGPFFPVVSLLCYKMLLAQSHGYGFERVNICSRSFQFNSCDHPHADGCVTRLRAEPVRRHGDKIKSPRSPSCFQCVLIDKLDYRVRNALHGTKNYLGHSLTDHHIHGRCVFFLIITQVEPGADCTTLLESNMAPAGHSPLCA